MNKLTSERTEQKKIPYWPEDNRAQTGKRVVLIARQPPHNLSTELIVTGHHQLLGRSGAGEKHGKNNMKLANWGNIGRAP